MDGNKLSYRLQKVAEYVPADRMVRSLTFFQVIKRNLKNLFKNKK